MPCCVSESIFRSSRRRGPRVSVCLLQCVSVCLTTYDFADDFSHGEQGLDVNAPAGRQGVSSCGRHSSWSLVCSYLAQWRGAFSAQSIHVPTSPAVRGCRDTQHQGGLRLVLFWSLSDRIKLMSVIFTRTPIVSWCPDLTLAVHHVSGSELGIDGHCLGLHSRTHAQTDTC